MYCTLFMFHWNVMDIVTCQRYYIFMRNLLWLRSKVLYVPLLMLALRIIFYTCMLSVVYKTNCNCSNDRPGDLFCCRIKRKFRGNFSTHDVITLCPEKEVRGYRKQINSYTQTRISDTKSIASRVTSYSTVSCFEHESGEWKSGSRDIVHLSNPERRNSNWEEWIMEKESAIKRNSGFIKF